MLKYTDSLSARLPASPAGAGAPRPRIRADLLLRRPRAPRGSCAAAAARWPSEYASPPGPRPTPSALSVAPDAGVPRIQVRAQHHDLAAQRRIAAGQFRQDVVGVAVLIEKTRLHVDANLHRHPCCASRASSCSARRPARPSAADRWDCRVPPARTPCRACRGSASAIRRRRRARIA